MFIQVLFLFELKSLAADRTGQGQITILLKAFVLGMVVPKRTEVIEWLKIHKITDYINLLGIGHLTYVR